MRGGGRWRGEEEGLGGDLEGGGAARWRGGVVEVEGRGGKEKEPSFSLKGLLFLVQNHLFPSKKLVWGQKTNFLRKKNIFLEFGRIVPKKCFCFLVFS